MILSTRHRAQLGLASAFVVLAASITALLAVPHYSVPVSVADVGTVAPDFALTDATGANFSLADCRGHVVVLFFSPLASAGSVEYAQTLKTLARNYDTDARVKFASVNIGNGATLDAPLPRLDATLSADNIPTLLDSRATVASRYSAMSGPTVVVIDPRGVVCYRGPINSSAVTAGQFTSHSLLDDALHIALDNVHGKTVASVK